jgi:hypothetical protein
MAVLIFKTLITEGLTAWRAFTATGLGIFGTGLFHYATYESGVYAHIYGAFGFAVLALLLARLEKRVGPYERTLFLVAVTCAWLFLVRNQLLIVVLPLVLAVVLRHRRSEQSLKRSLFILAIPMVVAAAIQFMMVRIAAGELILYTYNQEKSFELGLSTHLAVLFSLDFGLFPYFPFLALLLVLTFWPRVGSTWGRIVIACSFLPIWITYGFWHPKTGLGGLGHRGFIDIMPLVLCAAAVPLSRLSRRQWLAFSVVAAVTTLVTVVFMLHYWDGKWDFNHITPQQYWGALL